ncbi:hypothetical protein GCM10022251_25270 [Phytohabitans flavus]
MAGGAGREGAAALKVSGVVGDVHTGRGGGATTAGSHGERGRARSSAAAARAEGSSADIGVGSAGQPIGSSGGGAGIWCSVCDMAVRYAVVRGSPMTDGGGLAPSSHSTLSTLDHDAASSA